ncbi:MAG TPA: phosphoribosyl-ATP diphosphatase, partial [Polyangiaceae bacterium]|nr:phosphoribosyl-ATP diphosphatase [Polyangiaceae bacterium]
QPVMIHRAPLGSLERFVGVLIEHFAGAFPLWLAPEQVRVLVVSEKSEQYGRSVEERLRRAGFRVSGDYRPEKIGAKIREEAEELAEALKNETDERVLSEAADVIYHVMVGLTQRGLGWREVIEVLAKRTHRSGHAEKASR